VSERHKGPIHLLITDVVMPGMTGPELARRLTARRPAMKVLFMSGYTDDAILHHGVLEPGTEFLRKPFTAGSLGGKVRHMLDASRNGKA
jgi:two-component system cell cycle sensor histidine kinase/response regulator CckA